MNFYKQNQNQNQKQKQKQQHNRDINHIFSSFEEYMFTNETVSKVCGATLAKSINSSLQNNKQFDKNAGASANNASTNSETQNKYLKTVNPLFTPFQKDKLFWCFYIIFNGFSDYELHNNDHYITEKNFKIQCIEKLRSIKKELKETKTKLNFKMNVIEDELLNQTYISLKGLEALCFAYGVSITVISGKTYSEICNFNPSIKETDIKKGIIIQTDKAGSKYENEYSIKYNDEDTKAENDNYLNNIHNTYWKIENLQKPLNAVSGYTVKELQDICKKLDIPIINELGKNKIKQILYQAILSKM